MILKTNKNIYLENKIVKEYELPFTNLHNKKKKENVLKKF